MSFHKSNFGAFGQSLPSDIDGYVPEAGDSHEDMNFDAMTEWTEEGWEEYVAEAVEATAEAQASLNKWQEANA